MNIRLDLGIKGLIPEWKSLLSRDSLAQDAVAGLTVATIAVPLSLAISMASNREPGAGLVTAIVGSIVAAMFGGTRLAVTGPAAGMAVLIAEVVERHGVGGLIIVGCLCGLLQMLTGIFNLGRVIKLVPPPVVKGFLAGIGAIIFVSQLPRAFGLPQPKDSHLLDILKHVGGLVHQAKPESMIITLVTIFFVFGLPRFNARIPAALVGVLVPTLVVAIFQVETPLIGKIPSSLPMPKIPSLPEMSEMWGIAGMGVSVYALASLETLLSSAVVDDMTKTRHNPDQELIGQGMANVVVSLFGGIPVTGVIARSALNVHSGAKTRRSAIFHAVVLIGVVYVFSDYMAKIPVAALAGVLLASAMKMLDPKELIKLMKKSRWDGGIFVVTFLAIVALDLVKGVMWGGAAALVVVFIRMSQTKVLSSKGENRKFVIEGPLTFLAAFKMQSIKKEIEESTDLTPVIFDLTKVVSLDVVGAEWLVEIVTWLKDQGVKVVLLGLADVATLKRILDLSKSGVLEGTLAQSEDQISSVLRLEQAQPKAELTARVGRYKRTKQAALRDLYKQLGDNGQAPKVMFIGCSDSRVVPSLILSAGPGEVFTKESMGNLVFPFQNENPSPSGAEYEFAIAALGVTDVVICGHSKCGAIRALREKDVAVPANMPSVQAWVNAVETRGLCCQRPHSMHNDAYTKDNVLLQVEHLKSYPLVQEGIKAGKLSLHAWFFDVTTGDVEQYDSETGTWQLVADDADENLNTPSGEQEQLSMT